MSYHCPLCGREYGGDRCPRHGLVWARTKRQQAVDNPASCCVVRPSNQSIDTASTDFIDFTAGATVSWDTHGMFSTGDSDQLTVIVPGVYQIEASIAFEGNATGYRYFEIVAAGTIVSRVLRSNLATDGVQVSLSALANLAAGDAIAVRVRQTSGGALNVVATDYSPRLSVCQLRQAA